MDDKIPNRRRLKEEYDKNLNNIMKDFGFDDTKKDELRSRTSKYELDGLPPMSQVKMLSTSPTNNRVKFLNSGVGSNIFVYWLMFFEFMVMLALFFQYESESFGVGQLRKTALVLYQSYENVSYFQYKNIWIGPPFAALIREGASFAPCFHWENTVLDAIKRRNLDENQSGCCLKMDLENCVQSSRDRCSNKTSFWMKYKNKPGPVCGADNRYCIDPPMSNITDIIDWPVCNQYNFTALKLSKADLHMKCSLSARPCCIGIYGKCVMVPKQHCELMEGIFHSEATLCSQVDCLKGVCGELFYPHQYHRLILSIFMHPGLVLLCISFFTQWYYLTRVEKLLGTWRLAILYVVPGIVGNLASSIFLPHIPEVGPNSAIAGSTSYLIYIVFKERHKYSNSCKIILKITFLLFISQLIPSFFTPYINVFSISVGHIVGFCIAVFIHPVKETRKKKILSVITLAIIIVILSLSHVFIHDHRIFDNFNCLHLPLLKDMCSIVDTVYEEIKTLN